MKAILILSSDCNMSCRHCYLTELGSREPSDTLTTIKQLKGDGHEIILTGGETMLNRGYLEAYQEAGQRYILTNGILLSKDKELYDTIRRYGIDQIEFSIHFGIDGKINSVPEKTAAQAVCEANSRGFKTCINTVITSSNYRGIETFCQKAAEYGASSIEFLRYVPVTGPEGRALTQEQTREVFDKILTVRRKYNKNTLEITLHGNFGPRPRSQGEKLAEKNEYCPAGKSLVAITPDNNVYACPFLIRAGAIGRYDNGEILIERELPTQRRDTCIAHLLNTP